MMKREDEDSLNREGETKKHISRETYALILYLVGLIWIWKSGILKPSVRGTLTKFEPLHSFEQWRWNKVLPTNDLIWHRCWENFDCARLDVPLDWLDPSDDLRASIAIIRLNATDRKDYKGPVFINPGGPGRSGVWAVKKLGPYYQAVVGRNYDIISFDPRGVGASTPTLSCWNSKKDSRIWNLKELDVVDAHPGVIYDVYNRASAFSQHCASMIGGRNDTTRSLASNGDKVAHAGAGRFVSTASVARDMLEIMEKAGESKLKYWGFSYGTMLGTTFAAMFPDKVDRMVNDGNVNANELTSDSGIHFIQDADKVMEAFYDFCYVVGPIDCKFYAGSPAKIEERLDHLLEKIRKNPVVVPALSSGGSPTLVSYSGIRRMIASALYRPLAIFPQLSEALAGLEIGDGTSFMKISRADGSDPFQCDADPSTPRPELSALVPDATIAILCSDARFANGTLEDFQDYVSQLSWVSKSAGATMASIRLGCVGWSVEAKWRFAGPFAGNTSTPILFIANKADNVTPYRSAVQNARGFKDSVVLVQNSYGHTSLATPSRCTAKAIRAYFQSGTLPASGTICDADLMPFDKFNVTKAADREVTVGDSVEDLDIALINLMLAPVMGGSHL